jgi:predicted porin
MLRPLVAALAAALVVCSYSAQTVAQSSADEAHMRNIQQQIDQLSRELREMKEEQAKTNKVVSASEKRMDTFLKGFFGTMDASLDYTTKGMNGMQAFPFALAPGVTSPNGPFVITGGPKAAPFGRVGWMAAMSSNGSNFGYRGSHKIGDSDFNFVYQVATAFDVSAAPGLQDTWTKSSNTVKGAIGLGDTFIGLQHAGWGRLRFGEMFMPYKTSTDRLNPFAGLLGNYSVMLGNTGGDNRVEFGTRMDHVIRYDSPNWNGVSFDAAYALGQNPDPNNNIMPLGSPDCAGANNPGSGNLFLNCDDGGFNNAYSADLKFEQGGLYLVTAYELHQNVNRSSDGVGSNNPYYDYVFGLGPTNPLSASMLDWADYQAYAAEYPGAALAGTPEYSTAVDMANEWAWKIGGQYRFEFGLTISYLWEAMHRDLPASMEFQNERTRNSDWVAIEYDFNNGIDRIAAGWAHAGATPGDPGGQHNYNPNGVGNNQANMYTVAWWHKLDKQLTWYFDAADTANDGNAHFDIGAGGHGIKTDCHDATHPLFIDYSSAGPTTWGGCHEIGVSTGLNFKF